LITGIHHITAIAADPQPNLDFYVRFLGLRLVKRTVNFDDPGTYHFYYGDVTGQPGTILTFFPWPGARAGRLGTGQVSATAFAAPVAALDFWRARAESAGLHLAETTRFGERILSFADPDGLPLEIAGVGGDHRAGWQGSTVPPEHAISGFRAATLAEEGYETTARLLTEMMSFRLVAQDGARFRYEIGRGGPGATVDVVCMPDARRGAGGAGTVHHIAWRTPDFDSQLEWRARLAAAGHNVTPVMDRNYFRSIYFREPGGVLFEIATDPPGFTIDEPLDRLGAELKLPPQYEPVRERIEQILPPIEVP
jgi:glyoxalase family protein